MALKLSFRGRNVGQQFQVSATNNYGRVADAARDAITQARDEIKQRGDADIRAAGNFGKRWTEGWQSELVPNRGRTINLALRFFHTIPYAGIHERGGTIRGNPLLWIPLPWTGIKIRAREYGRRYGLFYVERKGGKNPLLLSSRDKEPKYVGVESVRLKKRFHLRMIIADVANKIPNYYRAAMRRRKR